MLCAPAAAESLAEAVASRLSANEPMYVIAGSSGDTTARFQLSFKYRLFDRDEGWTIGYTQASIWNLSDASKPFHDTNYRPSLFWQRERADDKAWVDALSAGYEHESNGKNDANSRSIDTLFVRPAWHWTSAGGKRLEFAPKIYGYLEKKDNPDIQRYRGYADWWLRYGDRERLWAAMARWGTADKGSLTLDWFERLGDFAIGPLPGYFHAQVFAGYGESLLDYNVRSKTQLRIGFAVVP